jgi:CDP-glycerol glycerophosphotransferase (TagB/SpsB family)
MNREKAIRMGFYDAIKAALSFDGNPVHTYDSLTTNEVQNEQQYVLLTQQSSVNSADFRRFRWNCVQTIEITSKQYSSVSKDIVDDISEQIEQIIIYPESQPGNGGMIAQSGWEFTDVLLESTNYIEVEISANYYEITKVLQFSCIATKLI